MMVIVQSGCSTWKTELDVDKIMGIPGCYSDVDKIKSAPEYFQVQQPTRQCALRDLLQHQPFAALSYLHVGFIRVKLQITSSSTRRSDVPHHTKVIDYHSRAYLLLCLSIEDRSTMAAFLSSL